MTVNRKYIAKLIVLVALACSLLIGCDEEEKISPREPAEVVNARPYPFNVSVLKVGSDYAVIDWGPVVDEENDRLYQSVYLGEVIVAQGLQTDSICKLVGLQPLTEYSGKVVVTDSITEAVVVPFSFTTKKRFNTFSRMFEGYNGRIPDPSSMTRTYDGGYVISGGINFNHDARGHYLAKMDSLGFEVWHTMIEDHVGVGGVGGGVVHQTSDNGFIVNSGRGILLFDESGNLQWHVHGLSIMSVVETTGHEFMALKTGGAIELYDRNGNLLWTKYYDEDEFTRGTYLTRSGDGNYVILGTAGGSAGYNDVSVTKIDPAANVLWSKVYVNGQSADFPRQIRLTSDNGFVIAADAGGVFGPGRVIKIDAEGIVEWDREYQFGSFNTDCNAIVETSDGSFVFTGSNGDSPQEAIIVKLDSNGDIVWKNHYKPEGFMDYLWSGFDLQLAGDGGFAVVGYKGSVWGNDTGKEIGMWLLKTNDEGELE